MARRSAQPPREWRAMTTEDEATQCSGSWLTYEKQTGKDQVFLPRCQTVDDGNAEVKR